METRTVLIIGTGLLLISAYLYWRYIWFFRNPGRAPKGSGLVSPADGRVVYAREVGPREKVIAIKKGAAASINDICRQDLACPKIHIGIFMSPFNVHYNRAPLSGEIKFIHHFPADPDNVQMLPMHWRSLFRRIDYTRNSLHLLQNERTVTCIEGMYREQRLPCYVVQIAGKRVRGIESFFKPGQQVACGEIFGMIRIGSQVDVVVPRATGLRIRVRTGDRVRDGVMFLLDQYSISPLPFSKLLATYLKEHNVMESSGSVKIDLHLHSKYSRNPSTWILKKIGCPESFSEPLLLYQLARERGLTHVTITDHNQLAGSLDIAHLPNTFLSEEVTTYFPEDRCKLHVLVYRIDEAIHREIQTLRENVFELVPYLRSRRIFHVLAHPLYGVNERLTLSHFERCLLLFNYFELNGARDGQLNILLRELLSRLRREDLDKLAARHNLAPCGDQPWKKHLTGGSDDHSTLSVGRQYTEVPGARTLPDFFEGLEQGRSVVSGEASSPASLARTIYSIAYQFYCHKFTLDKYLHKDLLLRLLHRFLHSPHQGESRLLSKVYDLLHVRLRSSKTQQTLQSLPDYLRFEIYTLLAGDPALKQFLKNGGDQTRPLEEDWFSLVNQVSNRILFQIGNVLLDNLTQGNVFSLFQAVGSAGSLYFLMAPYFIAFSHFAQDRHLAGEISRSCPLGPSTSPAEHRLRIAHFTDTFYQVNGVALTLQQQVAMAKKNNKRLTVITCDWIDGQETEPGIKKFRPVGSYDLAEYPEFKLHFPPFLEMLQYCYQEQFTAIHTATPGPVGLAALAITRILKRPCYSTYHTSIPQYARYLTEDPDMEELAWKYICWYYNQMDRVYVPSQSTRQELIEKGLAAEKIQLFARGIDTQRFHPDKRNGYFEARFPVRSGFKLLYVGRVSKEKNLQVLGEAYKRLWHRRKDLQLIIVGDGPYLKEFQDWMSDTPCLFTGYLDGEDLAAAYASVELFIFPSSTDTFGNVILEAQASGLPVIVTDQGGPQENILPGKTGVIIPADDPQALGEAVENLVADPLRLKRMGQAARQFLEDRSFEKAFQETWEMYRHPLRPGESVLAEAV